MYIFIERTVEEEGGEIVFYLIFQLIPFDVLLYAFQEVVGVKVLMTRRMSETNKGGRDVLKINSCFVGLNLIEKVEN